ncbi:MAG: PH domain-containing protein [Thermoanaerobaculales bacterium]
MRESSVRVFRPAPAGGASRLWFGILLGIVSLVFIYLLVTYLRVPVIRYQIDGTTLTIHSALGSSTQEKHITLARIGEIRPELLRGGSLRFGTEKPGYCVGLFAYPTLGEVSQITDCSELAVLLVTSGEVEPIVVTPGDRDGFIAALRNARPGSFVPPTRVTGAWWATLITLLLAYLVVVAALVTAFFLAPRRLAYAVRGDALEVTTLFGRRRLGLIRAKVFKHRPLVGARLSGVFLPGYLVGTALWDGMATTVLASVRDEGVVLEAEGRIFLSPADCDGFLAALAQAGATIVTPEMQRRR